MRWCAEPTPKLWDKKAESRFAWFPVKIGTSWVWLERYWAVVVYSPYPDGFGLGYRSRGWATKSLHLLENSTRAGKRVDLIQFRPKQPSLSRKIDTKRSRKMPKVKLKVGDFEVVADMEYIEEPKAAELVEAHSLPAEGELIWDTPRTAEEIYDSLEAKYREVVTEMYMWVQMLSDEEKAQIQSRLPKETADIANQTIYEIQNEYIVEPFYSKFLTMWYAIRTEVAALDKESYLKLCASYSYLRMKLSEQAAVAASDMMVAARAYSPAAEENPFANCWVPKITEEQ